MTSRRPEMAQLAAYKLATQTFARHHACGRKEAAAGNLKRFHADLFWRDLQGLFWVAVALIIAGLIFAGH